MRVLTFLLLSAMAFSGIFLEDIEDINPLMSIVKGDFLALQFEHTTRGDQTLTLSLGFSSPFLALYAAPSVDIYSKELGSSFQSVDIPLTIALNIADAFLFGAKGFGRFSYDKGFEIPDQFVEATVGIGGVIRGAFMKDMGVLYYSASFEYSGGEFNSSEFDPLEHGKAGIISVLKKPGEIGTFDAGLRLGFLKSEDGDFLKYAYISISYESGLMFGFSYDGMIGWMFAVGLESRSVRLWVDTVFERWDEIFKEWSVKVNLILF